MKSSSRCHRFIIAAATLQCLLLILPCHSFYSTFHGTHLVVPNSATMTNALLVMRKQKASDKRTTRRQRGVEQDEDQRQRISSAVTLTRTTSPMQGKEWSHKKTMAASPMTTTTTSTAATTTSPSAATAGRGRGRSRKRSALYQAVSHYHNHFLHLLTAEYQAEEEEVLGRIKSSVDDPLGLEVAGYAIFDLYAERRGNLFSDEVYRLTKAADATTLYPRTVEQDNTGDNQKRYLPPNHKFTNNDIIMLTLQPNGSGDFFSTAALPISETSISMEARVLNMGPTYVDVAVPAGLFEATFGPAPNDRSGVGDKSLRLRADHFFSNIPYQRMVSALQQITTIPERSAKKVSSLEGEEVPSSTTTAAASSIENIVMDEVIREAVLMTYQDPNAPFVTGAYDVEELSNKLSKPPMGSSQRLTSQVIKYMKSNQQNTFPYKFNAPQLTAIEAALSRRLSIVHGPPGSGKTRVAAAIAFGFVHQCRSISPHTKVLACAFSNVGADNLAEALMQLGLNVIRVGKPSAVVESLWDITLEAAIDRDPEAQKALKNAARATAQLGKMQRRKSRTTDLVSEQTARMVATEAVKAAIKACNVAAAKALRQADVIVSTSTGAADPRLLSACGIAQAEDSSEATGKKKTEDSKATRQNAPDGLAPLSLPFVIVDEACQSVEPATLVPIVSTNSCRSLVLLGDPCQLPPTVRSRQADPLSVSLMERLASLLPHPNVNNRVDNTVKDTSYLDTLAVKQAKSLLRARDTESSPTASYRKRFAGSLLLSIQYRMHPSIAALPSAVFYDGLLATPSSMAEARTFPDVLHRKMPCGDPNLCVRVIDVGGPGNERQGMPSRYSRTVFGSASNSSPLYMEELKSYWNEPEAQRVMFLLKDILSEPAQVKSIGVISPYNAQVQLIKSMIAGDGELRDLVRASGVSIEVKSVDGYQGRERDVIIFSAVRSNRHGRIGFLHDWRRMNVALTRAKAALLVVGDMSTLADADKHWAAFLKWANTVRCVVDDFDSPEDEPSL